MLGGLFGPFYRDADWPLALLTMGQLVLTWAGSSHTTLLMTGHQNEALTVNSVAALLLAVGGWLAASHFGITGLALTYTAVVALESAVLMLLCRRLTGVCATASLPMMIQAAGRLFGAAGDTQIKPGGSVEQFVERPRNGAAEAERGASGQKGKPPYAGDEPAPETPE